MNINKLIEGQRHDEEKMGEIRSEFVNDLCRVEPYRDTTLTYWKGILEKNFNLIPTPKSVFNWFEESIKQYAEHYLIKFLDSEIERLIILRTENDTKSDDFALGIDKVLTDQITHLQDIKKQLE